MEETLNNVLKKLDSLEEVVKGNLKTGTSTKVNEIIAEMRKIEQPELREPSINQLRTIYKDELAKDIHNLTPGQTMNIINRIEKLKNSLKPLNYENSYEEENLIEDIPLSNGEEITNENELKEETKVEEKTSTNTVSEKEKETINIVEIDGNYILDQDLERYNELKAEYNRLYDMANATDLGDEVDNLSPEEIEEMNNIEKELEELKTKGKNSIRLELIDDKVVFESDLERYKELKAEYNRLYDMQNATDFGDNIDSLTPEEIEEMHKIEARMEEIRNKADKMLNIKNPKKTETEILRETELSSENKENETDLIRDALIEAIEKEKELGNSLDESELEEWALNVRESVNKLYEYDQKKFIEQLNNTNNLDNKLDLIEKREKQIESGYKDFFKHDRKEADDVLEKQYELFIDDIKEKYNNDKSNGEYVWANFDAVKESREYIKNNIDNDNDLRYQFDVMSENLDDLINSPTEEAYNEWKQNMGDFIQNANLDVTKITPYLNAYLKNKNKDLSIDNNLNINGLDLKKEKETEKETPKEELGEGKETSKEDVQKEKESKPKKMRKKVVKVVKDIHEWFKKHPVIRAIAIGLAVAVTLPLAGQALMMINSSLWGVAIAAGNPALAGMLHSVNTGLAYMVTGGKFAFEAGSGLYTLGGAVGAQALYTAATAKLVSAGLLLGIPGILVANKIRKNKKKTTEEPEKAEEKEVEEKEIENTEEIEKEKEKVKDKEVGTDEQQKQEDVDNENKEASKDEQKKQDDINKENVRLLGVLKEALQKSEKQNQQLREENSIMNEKLNQMFQVLTPEQKQMIVNKQQNKEVAEFDEDRIVLS